MVESLFIINEFRTINFYVIQIDFNLALSQDYSSFLDFSIFWKWCNFIYLVFELIISENDWFDLTHFSCPIYFRQLIYVIQIEFNLAFKREFFLCFGYLKNFIGIRDFYFYYSIWHASDGLIIINVGIYEFWKISKFRTINYMRTIIFM